MQESILCTWQQPPLSIQVELTEGCNLGCKFCGLQGMKDNGKTPWKFMTIETATLLAKQIKDSCWGSRIIFSMHGEPTLNPDILKIISTFRQHLPNAIFSMMSNGHGIANRLDEGSKPIKQREALYINRYINLLFKSGLTDLIIDYYSPKGDAAIIEAAVTTEGNFFIQRLEKGIPLYAKSNKRKRILFNPPIQTEGAINRHLCNHCGAAGPLDTSYKGKRCARPFRELSIRWDGSVAICCNDFRGEYPIGSIHYHTIETLWQNKRFKAARILLYAGKRIFKPCLGCNALSHRVGLLPDRMGKQTMQEPSKEIKAFADSISEKNKPLCGKVVKRPWEK